VHARQGELAERIEQYEGEIAALKKTVGDLDNTCEGLLHREALKAAEYDERPKEIVDLEAEKQQLTELIATLKPSKPEKGK
jgi:chromosome segregation ATPase